jgi:hypothetical protein
MAEAAFNADPVHGFAAAVTAGVEYGLQNVACKCYYKTMQLAINTMEIKTYSFCTIWVIFAT